MAKSILSGVKGGATSAAGSTTYSGLTTGGSLASGQVTVESTRQIPYHTAGKIALLAITISANATSASSALTLRVNGVDATQTVTIPSGATGTFIVSGGGSDTIAAGDLIGTKLVTGAGGTLQWRSICATFDAVHGKAVTICHTADTGNVNYSTASTTWYPGIFGVQFSNTTESRSQQLFPAGVFSKLAVYISANARTSASDITLRVNGADTGVTVSIGAGATGLFEDTTNTATVADGDVCNYKLVTGAGTGNLSTFWFKIEFTSDTSTAVLGGGHSSGSSLAAGATGYVALGHSDALSATAIYSTITGVSHGILCNYRQSVPTNASNGSSTFTVMLDGVATPLEITVPAGGTGAFSDTTNIAPVVSEANEGSIRYINGGGSGAVLIAAWTLQYKPRPRFFVPAFLNG